ncbi:MAG TPA: SDR family NAD(P)-dependent oxidoreductase [Pirellulales bacterium]|jgi:NAD(P)-dependent dehydrogenase (short-subunit alcohol dehydrogenase family)|nr:SDR family NAD(P)-dependent oxidoreductase [Pirellulales bacterium]
MSSWQGKVALVTGASGGLGLAISQAFAAAGAHVVMAARGTAALERAAQELTRQGGQVLAIPADVTRGEDVEHLLGQTLERFGRLDVLVNNAGRSARRAVLDTTPEDFQQLLELNLLAVVRCTRAAAPHLLASGGHLVNIGSLAGKSASRYLGAYPASKFALTAYTQQLRLELGPQGLHVLLVCPGPIARDQPPVAAKPSVSGLPDSALRPGAGVKTRAVRPEKIAAAILRACQRRQGELVFPPAARVLFALMQLSPRLADWLVRVTT